MDYHGRGFPTRDRARFLFMDKHDLIGGVGLILIFVGLWAIYPPAAAIVVGGFLFVIGLMGARRGHTQ